MINELDRVVLTEAVPGESLEKGDVGTVVHVYDAGKAYGNRVHNARRPHGGRRDR